ncbi:hypothetical protein ElyMa_004474100 [Elysia marginata]|uniref:Reverse transcriptase domain-containing protein n=1 Tax=Elysia marginata TaxID=1093978 RepID=A0AAV4HKJ3_9GAST|nr:hypothetical protein ElyMa_004474100 [Elysia marginata]
MRDGLREAVDDVKLPQSNAIVRQIQEKCQEHNVDLITTFVDLTKAFDTVSREDLWQIMSKFGRLDRFIQMVSQFHDSMQAQVLDDG